MGKDLKGKELGVGLTQRKDKKYSAKFTKKNGERPEKYFDKLSDAREWLNEQKYLDKLLFGGDMTVDEWYNVWIANFKQGIVKDNTEKNYKNRYKINIKPVLGHLKLTEVKQINCQEVLVRMHDRYDYSNGTMEQARITMHALFKGAVENNYIIKNPVDGTKIKKRPLDEEKARFLTIPEQEEFLTEANGTQYYNAFKLVLLTGLRCGEIGGLQWDDIDFDNRVIYVKRTLLQDGKKGGFYFGSPKSKQSIRKIPLVDEAIQILNNQKIHIKKMKLMSKKWDEQWENLVFRTVNGKPTGNSTYNDRLNSIVVNINRNRIASGNEMIFEDIHMHSLRHTFATRCIESGVQPKTLQKILGHSTLAVTMDLYVHVTDEQAFNEIQKINSKNAVVKVS